MIRDILKKLFPSEESKTLADADKIVDGDSFLRLARGSARGVKLQGISDLLVTFGKCCNPIPGDDLMGFVTRGRGITLHRADCASLPLLDEDSDRIIPVDWDVGKNETFSVRIKVVSQDVEGGLGRKIIFDTESGSVLLRRNPSVAMRADLLKKKQ